MIQLLFCFSLDPGTEPLQIEPVHLDKANIFLGVKNLEPTAKLPKLLPPKIEGLVLECQQNARISGITVDLNFSFGLDNYFLQPCLTPPSRFDGRRPWAACVCTKPFIGRSNQGGNSTVGSSRCMDEAPKKKTKIWVPQLGPWIDLADTKKIRDTKR